MAGTQTAEQTLMDLLQHVNAIGRRLTIRDDRVIGTADKDLKGWVCEQVAAPSSIAATAATQALSNATEAKMDATIKNRKHEIKPQSRRMFQVSARKPRVPGSERCGKTQQITGNGKNEECA